MRGWLLRSVADDDVEVVVDRFVFDVVLSVPFPLVVVVPLALLLVTEPFATTLLPPRRAAARLVLKLLLWSSSLKRRKDVDIIMIYKLIEVYKINY